MNFLPAAIPVRWLQAAKLHFNNIMEYFKIQIDGHQFTKGYLLYVIEIINSTYGKYYYVGQTGDTHHVTARPAFRRLSAHLSDQGHSNENQLYKAIVTQILKRECVPKMPFDANTKDSVTQFLSGSTINMHAFPIRQFDSTTTLENHILNRKFVENIECSVINGIISNVGRDRVLNKRLTTNETKIDKNTSELIENILGTTCP